MYNMTRRFIFSPVLILILNIVPLTAAGHNRPYGMMTDLIEYAGQTWQDGYVSSLPVWKLESSIKRHQWVAIGSVYPNFSWIVPGEKNNTVQQSYHVIVSDNLEDIRSFRGNVWDSGMVDDCSSSSVPYGGEALKPAKNYFWRVKVCTNTDGESEWSVIKSFRTSESMEHFSVAHYPVYKTIESPGTVKLVNDNILFADFGKEAFSQLTMTLSASNHDDTLRIRLGEIVKDGRIVGDSPNRSMRYRSLLLPLMKGCHTYRIDLDKDKRNTGPNAIKMPDYIGEILPFRYCEIEGDKSIISDVKLTRERVQYYFDNNISHFESSSEMLNKIWDFCKYSICATSFTGIYVDGDRERIPYEADAYINQLCHYGVDKEYSMARRTLEYLLKHPTWPTEWIMQAVLMAWQDYMYTGDKRLLKKHYDLLRNRTLLGLREKNGLISTVTGLQTGDFLSSINMKKKIKDIVDWPHAKKGDNLWNVMGEDDGFEYTEYNAVVNVYHYEALRQMCQMAEVLGLEDDAKYLDKEMQTFKKNFFKNFYDGKSGIFMDGITSEVNHGSLHSNMFPLAFRMLSAKKAVPVIEHIKKRGMACSVYGAQFLMEALFNYGCDDYALELLLKTDDRGWVNMIRNGATISTEAWDDKYKTNQDWNHAWGAAPANIIPRYIAGVRPLKPGCETVIINPQCASLSWFDASVPTIRGTVKVSVKNDDERYILDVVIPANMKAEIVLPKKFQKYGIYQNSRKLVKPMDDDGTFVNIGTVGSGTYRWEMVRK